MENPIVSVIIPVYNVAAYLPRCVESVLAQTLTSIEILLVDDGSTDGSAQLCDEYATRDSRVHVLHQANGGLGSARNAGLDAATGEHLAFVDSDDYIAPDMMERLYSALLNNNADICICGFQRTDENGLALGENSHPSCVLSGTEALEKLYSPAYQYFTIACNKLFKRDLFAAIRFPLGKLFEDGYAAFRYYYTSRTVVCLPECYYFYCLRGSSITNAPLSVKNLDGIDADRDSLVFLTEKGLTALVEKAQTKYVASILYNLKRFRLQPKEIRLKFKTVKKDFRPLYRGILKNAVLTNKEKVLISLFRFSPRLCKLVIKIKKL